MIISTASITKQMNKFIEIASNKNELGLLYFQHYRLLVLVLMVRIESDELY